jgi:acetyl esterase/lipase
VRFWPASVLAIVSATLVAGATAATHLMDWPDLLRRPLPRADERLAYGTGQNQFGDLWVPATPGRRPLVIMIHGGCWHARVATLSIMNYPADDLRRRGFVVWNIEYRGVELAGGGYPGTFLDVAAAADALRTIAPAHHLDLGRVVVVGHSAGGHLAAWLAARRRLPAGGPLAPRDPLPIAGVVSLGGLPDLKADRAAGGAACGAGAVDAMTGSPSASRPDVYADTSPAERLPLGVPEAIVNGSEDPVAPPWLGRAYAQSVRAAGDPVTFVEVPETGHVELIAPGSAAWARAVTLITRMVR